MDSIRALVPLMLSSYSFKVAFALADTPFFYLGIWLLEKRVGVRAEAVGA